MMLTPNRKNKILRESNYICIYCGDPANQIDHIFPRSYTFDDGDDNLAASCTICNMIAGDLVFDSFIEKQSYILEQRRSSKYRKMIQEYRSLCTASGLPISIEIGQAVLVPEMKKKKIRRSSRNKPKLPRRWDGLSSSKQMEMKSVKSKPVKRRIVIPEITFIRSVMVDGKVIHPSFDYSNIDAYQVCFRIKHDKKGLSYDEIGSKYGLTPSITKSIAEGENPGNEIREKLNLPPVFGVAEQV